VRGRNRKWLGTRDWRAVGEIGLVVVFKLHARVEECGGRHVCVRSQYSCREPVNGEEGVDCGELVADFLFLGIEKTSNMLDHLFVGKSQLIASRAVWRRGGDNVGGAVNAVGRERRAGRDEDGGRGAGHHRDGWAVMWCVEGKK